MSDVRTVAGPDERAALAEEAVRHRFLGRLWFLPGTAVAAQRWPISTPGRVLGPWHYWWHAQLLDCLTDAQLRRPTEERRRLARAVVRGIHLRNRGWSRSFHDDLGLMALALLRAGPVFGFDRRGAITRIAATLRNAWSDDLGGGIPWRPGDVFKNAPANGPAALLFARLGDLDRAARTLDWIEATLADPQTGLIFDGIRPGLLHREFYGYCQGAVLGAELELVRRTGHPPDRVHRIVGGIAEHLAAADVLPDQGVGDWGLYSGIAARYLALVARDLPGSGPADQRARDTAARVVRASSAAAWQHADDARGLPVFGADWSRPVTVGEHPRDLSVQLGAWTALEAAATLAA